MLESACSRVGHIYRYRPISVNLHIKYDFVSTVSVLKMLNTLRKSIGVVKASNHFSFYLSHTSSHCLH